ncbi:hypothetical protein D9M69_577340 [compost metagenome]
MALADFGQAVQVVHVGLGARHVQKDVVRAFLAQQGAHHPARHGQPVEQVGHGQLQQDVELGEQRGGVDLGAQVVGGARFQQVLGQARIHHLGVAHRVQRGVVGAAGQLVGEPAVERGEAQHHERVAHRVDLVAQAVGGGVDELQQAVDQHRVLPHQALDEVE